MIEGWLAFTGEHALGEPGVHRLRVSIRREQARWRAYPDAVPQAGARKTARRVWRKVMKAAGRVRNVDIALGLARESGASAELVPRLEQKREKRAARLERLLRKKARPEFTWPAYAPDAPAARPVLERFFRAGRAAGAKPGVHRLHALRLAGKRLRYLLELSGESDAAQAGLRDLKRLQDALGAINDCVTARQFARGHRPFQDWLAAEITRRRAAFAGLWEESFQRPERWYALLGVLSGPGPGTTEE